MMTPEEFKNLNTGDMVRISGGHTSYVVTANYGGRATAVRTVDLANPKEWELVLKANLRRPEKNQP